MPWLPRERRTYITTADAYANLTRLAASCHATMPFLPFLYPQDFVGTVSNDGFSVRRSTIMGVRLHATGSLEHSGTNTLLHITFNGGLAGVMQLAPLLLLLLTALGVTVYQAAQGADAHGEVVVALWSFMLLAYTVTMALYLAARRSMLMALRRYFTLQPLAARAI